MLLLNWVSTHSLLPPICLFFFFKFSHDNIIAKAEPEQEASNCNAMQLINESE